MTSDSLDALLSDLSVAHRAPSGPNAPLPGSFSAPVQAQAPVVTCLPVEMLEHILDLTCPERVLVDKLGYPSPLRIACLVSKQWREIAQRLLWANVRLVGKKQCVCFWRELKSANRVLPRTFKLSIAATDDQFSIRKILRLRPGLQSLRLHLVTLPSLTVLNIAEMSDLRCLTLARVEIGMRRAVGGHTMRPDDIILSALFGFELYELVEPKLDASKPYCFRLESLCILDSCKVLAHTSMFQLPLASMSHLTIKLNSDSGPSADIISSQLPNLRSLRLLGRHCSHAHEEPQHLSLRSFSSEVDLAEAINLDSLSCAWWDLLAFSAKMTISLRHLEVTGCEVTLQGHKSLDDKQLVTFRPADDILKALKSPRLQNLETLHVTGLLWETLEEAPLDFSDLRCVEEMGVKVTYGGPQVIFGGEQLD